MGRVIKPLQGGGLQVSKYEAMPNSCSGDYYCAANNVDAQTLTSDLKAAPAIAPVV